MDIEVAPDFPKARYMAVEERIAQYLGAMQASATAMSGVSEYAGGWNAVILRFRAADEFGISAIAALAHGGAPPNDVRYVQERDLFGFFANVLSTIESCCYAIYHIARIAGVPGFDRAPRDVTVSATAAAIAAGIPGSFLDAALAALIADGMWQRVNDIRNILVHRESPARTVYMGTSGHTVSPAEWTTLGLALDATLVERPREWLGRTIQQLVDATQAFALASF